jgi:hypothetical protein
MALQKFTKTEDKFGYLLSKKIITKRTAQSVLNKDELKNFKILIIEKLQELKYKERDRLEEQTINLFEEDFKNQIWERNHILIVAEISNYMNKYGMMPSNNNIVDNTGLSRQTVHKHLKEFLRHSTNLDQIQKFRIMTERVLTVVFKEAIAGNMKAARLYLESVNNSTESIKRINTQNNYIQINETVLSQEKLNLLTPEQLNKIELVINTNN